MAKTETENFNMNVYIDELIEEMGMQNEDKAKLTKLKEGMFKALNRELFEAAAESIEPEVIDMVMADLKDEKDSGFILQELVQTSPSAQLAMLAVLDRFKENTLEAFNTLKN